MRHPPASLIARRATLGRREFSAALTLAALSPALRAQDIVNTLIVPYAPGGPSDTGGRRLSPEMAKALQQTVIVQNIAGAGGAIAAQRMLQLPADGRTFMYASPNELILVPALNQAVRYKPQEFVPVGLAARSPMVLVVRTGLPVKTVDELVQYAKAHPERELSYGSVGLGSFQHVLGAHLSTLLGIRMLHVPYKGSAPMYNDLLGQQVDVAVTTLSGGALGFIDAGKIRSLGMLTRERTSLAPHLATVQDSAALKGVEFTIWGGLFASAATPAPALATLQAAFRTTIAVPSVRAGIEAGGAEAFPPMQAQEMMALYREDSLRYAKLVKDAGIKIEQ